MKINWKKTSLIVLDVLLGVYLILAITAFRVPKEQTTVCGSVNVYFSDSNQKGFLTADEVTRLLKKSNLYPVGQPIAEVNTRKVEETLQGNILVEQAQCYLSPTGDLCINILQRVPVMKVMAQNGDRYYLDSKGGIIPDNGYASNLIVATGHISRQYATKMLSPIANHLQENTFWQSQTEQLNVLADGSVELVPRVGEHIAYLGQPVGVERKLERLRKFYLYGLSQAGWNKYKYISVEFDNQIICRRNDEV